MNVALRAEIDALSTQLEEAERGALTPEARDELLTRADRAYQEAIKTVSPQLRERLEHEKLVEDTILKLRDRVSALEARLASRDAGLVPMGEPLDELVREAESGPVLRWRGLWDEDITYRPGEVVCANSALWVCGAPGTTSKPGTSAGWRLVLKTPDLRGASRARGGR
jgi:hypothetical protein